MSNIKNIQQVREHAAMESKLNRIDVYSGFVDINNKGQRHFKVQVITPDPTTGSMDQAWNYFEKNNFGDFTAILYPTKTAIPFSNKNELTLNGTEMNYQHIPTEEQIQAQVQKILENERLKMRLEQLEQEQEENDMWGARMGVALNMLLDRFMGGNSTAIPTTEPALQGTDQETSTLNPTEQALVILVNSFGEEWLQKFAAKIKAEPHLINKIKAFFS